MKRKYLLGVAAVTSLAMATVGSPAQAASHTIKGTNVVPGASGVDLFQKSGCSTDVKDKVNGIDSVIIDVSSYAASVTKQIRITWTGNTTLSGALGGSLKPSFFSGSCAQVFNGALSSPRPGVWTLNVPASAKWLGITAFYVADVQLSTT